MLMTKYELLKKLPYRDYWFVSDLAEAFGLSKRTIQYCAKRKKIGKKVRQGPNGLYIFTLDDLDRLCENIHGEVGNPINKQIYRERHAR